MTTLTSLMHARHRKEGSNMLENKDLKPGDRVIFPKSFVGGGGLVVDVKDTMVLVETNGHSFWYHYSDLAKVPKADVPTAATERADLLGPPQVKAGARHTVELTPYVTVLVVGQLASLGVAFECGERMNGLIRVSVCPTRKRLLNEIVKVMHERSARA